MKFFVGVDQSLTNTAFVCLNSEANIVSKVNIFTTPEDVIEDRLQEIQDSLESFLGEVKPEYVYIEGLSFQSKGQSVAQLGAIHYILRIFLYQKGINCKIVAPTTLKKFVTGKGHSKKELMLKEVYKRWGVDLDDNNLADAYGLARMALEDFIGGCERENS